MELYLHFSYTLMTWYTIKHKDNFMRSDIFMEVSKNTGYCLPDVTPFSLVDSY